MRTKTYLKFRLFVAVFILAMVSTAMGRTIFVDADATGNNDGSSWANAYNHLQDALSAASSGDQIEVAEGVYKPDQGEGITHGDRTATFQLKNGVIIIGGYAGFGEPDPDTKDIVGYQTILSGDLNGDDGPDFANNGENSYHVVTSSGSDETAVLNGFTVTAGNADDDIIHQPDINYGGGMYNEMGSPTLMNCTFSRNLANQGGGMYNISDGRPILTNCTFIGNRAGYRGGGMLNGKSSRPTLTNCTFKRNHSARDGGGVCNRYGSLATLIECTFSENNADMGGGLSNDQCSPTLTNCRFNRNEAWEGGGMYNFGGRPTLINCTFSGNQAENGGSGMSNEGMPEKCDPRSGPEDCVDAIWCYPTLRNCTFVGNRSGLYGAITNSLQTRATIVNCIVWNNIPADIIPSYITGSANISYSDVEGGWPGEGNINADPLFIDADGADNIFGTDDDNLRLLPGSPCINAGGNTAVLPWVFTDLDGNPRIINGIVDMGAYEFCGLFNWYVNAADGDDNNDGSTLETAFATIQRAIDAAGYGDTVLVYPGIYTEEIVFLGKVITVQGVATTDGVPVLQNPDDFAVSFYYGEGPDSNLKNFVIRNSFMAIFIAGSNPTITNVTIVNNKYGIEAYAGAEPDISNSIFWNNTNGDLFGCQAAYSWVQDELESESFDSPISYWGFDEDTGNVAFDPIGDNHGTIYGGASRTEGISGGAFQFDGVDDYVDCGFSSSFCLLDDVSVTFWIKRQHQTKGTMLTIEGSPIDKGSEEDNSIFFLRIYTPQEVFEYIHEYGAGYNQTYHFPPIPYSKWTHVVVTRDSRARTVNAYFDGKHIGTFNYWHQAENPSEELDLVIGARSTGIDNYVGLLDEVALFDRVLSPQEIQMSYTLGLAGDSLDNHITRDPFFVDPDNGDYHLRSERGRYWPAHDVWVLDNITSPCIDGGDPTVDPSGEPMPNGGRINMGAYGGTAYASMSEMVWLDGDINHDGIVDMIDFAMLADNWLRVE